MIIYYYNLSCVKGTASYNTSISYNYCIYCVLTNSSVLLPSPKSSLQPNSCSLQSARLRLHLVHTALISLCAKTVDTSKLHNLNFATSAKLGILFIIEETSTGSRSRSIQGRPTTTTHYDKVKVLYTESKVLQNTLLIRAT